MRVLIDTNVLIDFISVRKPYYEAARRIIDACDRELLAGCIAAHSIPDIITRNEADFVNSSIPSISPDVFCRRFLDRL